MLSRFCFYGLLLSGLLASCAPEPESGPRIEFIGATGLTSNDRVLNTPGDSLVTRLVADTRDGKSASLSRFTITVDYTPFDADTARSNTPEILYFDQSLNGSDAFYYQHRFSARTLSGRERWTFKIVDTEGKTSSRGYLLTVNNPDSLRTYHPYQVPLFAARNATSRSSLAARDGLVFPAFPLKANPGLQASVDLVLVPAAGGAVTLASPTDASVLAAADAVGAGSWVTRNATALKTTSLSPTQFDQLTTSARITAVFDTVSAPAVTATEALSKDQVLAFRTTNNRTGLLHVKTLFGTTATPAAIVRVKVNE
ncbi:hypothetical protein HER32_09605 [Hymenobacter sp. BT18]|uniref:hypothetical protein n=1 Tax=Hymenobacter sp. BT18 TaxID=2835648 RepID=UPI00143E69D9|nr:hypothetical protein [Hymenobacter sp. BT18]QIX61420.1 hypothetical protein HER32_09605 [Hymenobacter sp. BT18]